MASIPRQADQPISDVSTSDAGAEKDESAVEAGNTVARQTGGPVLPRVVAIGAGSVDLCQSEGDRADEQSCRAHASPGGDVAEAEFGITFSGRLPVCGTDDDGAANPETAWPQRDGLSGAGDSGLAMWRESSTAASVKTTLIGSRRQ